MKYNREVSKLIAKLQEDKKEDRLTNNDQLKEEISCPVCDCDNGEHESYIYCKIIENYICDTCCRFEVCNDYQLLNKAFNKDIFKSNNEVIMLCQCCEQ